MNDTTHTPHVAPEWASAFVLESAHEAFGDPVTYPRARELPRNDSTFTTADLLGHLSILLVLGVLVAMLRNPEALVRSVVDRPWLLFMSNVVVLVAALLLTLDTSLLDIPALPLALAPWATAIATLALGPLAALPRLF